MTGSVVDVPLMGKASAEMQRQGVGLRRYDEVGMRRRQIPDKLEDNIALPALHFHYDLTVSVEHAGSTNGVAQTRLRVSEYMLSSDFTFMDARTSGNGQVRTSGPKLSQPQR